METVITLTIVCILSYWLAAILLGIYYRAQNKIVLILSSIVWSASLLLHAMLLSTSVFSSAGINLSFSNAFSTAGWLIALLLFIVSLTQPLKGLALIILPVSAFSLTIGLLVPDLTSTSLQSSLTLDAHIFLSLLAYSVLLLAAAQALLLSYQHTRLRQHKPVGLVSYLAPMQQTEHLMFLLIGLGFLLLTLSLGSGFFFLDNFLQKGQAHKTILSILAWLVFAVLLWGRWKLGWRGSRAIKLTLWGFSLLVLAYFGSKLIRELILHRA